MNHENKRSCVIYADFKRLALKAASTTVDDYELSDLSKSAAHTIIHGYFEQDENNKSQVGSAPKRKEGIWLATVDFIGQYPSESTQEIWTRISQTKWDSDDLRWQVYIDGDEMIQKDYGGQNVRDSKTTSIKFSTFQTEYFSKAKKLSKYEK